MASSQVEIASSSPFGCVLKDSNKRGSRENNNGRAAAFQKNLKELVRDHFNNCISISADENEIENGNQSSKNQHDNKIDSRVAKQQGNKKEQQHHPQHNRNLGLLTNHHDRNNENKRSLDDSDIITSSRQSRMLDRWAAQQAREMVSSIETQSQEAEPLASSSSTSSGNKENSRSSSNVGNLGASSLVQIWEARLTKSMNMSRNSYWELSSSRASSPGTEDPSRDSETEVSLDSMNHSNHEEPCTEWDLQSDRTAHSEPSQGRNLDAGEKERVRVADIIKKLTSGNDENENEMVTNASESPSRKRRNSAVTDQPEQQRRPSLVVNSPKIRGRQAFADLLTQLERDRHRELDSLVERQAVSRFPYRGRIQAMLRIRFLQRGLAIQDRQRPQSPRSLAKLLPQGSTTIMHLREKFSTVVEQGGTAHSDATATRISHTEIVNNRVNMESSSTTNRWRSEDSSHQQNHEGHNVGRQSRGTTEHSVPQTSKDNNNRKSSSRTSVETDHEVTAEATELLKSGDRSGIADDQEQQHTNLNSQNNSNSDGVPSLEGRNEIVMAAQQEQEANEHPHLADSQETGETTVSLNDWDEIDVEESYEQSQFVENNYDWIREISRPRSYWEDRRQAWYQEMLGNRSENEEIRRLLERRTVSSFLASDFRETMDRLMTSRIERRTDLEGYEDEEEDAISRQRIGQLLLSHLQRHLHPAVSQEEEQAGEGEEEEEEEEEEGDYTEEDEEEQSPTGHDQHHETSDYSDQSSSSMQMPSPTTMQSWGHRHLEVGDDHSDPVWSASSFHQDSRMSSSFTNRLPIEMEIIYDLRGQMAQLHREMTELRKSIRSRMDMQVTVQHSHPHPQEVHSVRGTENNSLDVATMKRKCCICYEMNVDSLLYRCGHMCTCLKCAHELQWSSGKCPICRSPIADVVKAYMDS